MTRLISLAVVLLFSVSSHSQESAKPELSMKDISAVPTEHGPGNMLGRMVEGLGFRYYWATDSLTQTDLDYRPSEEARSSFETLEHLYDLSQTISDFAHDRPSARPITSRPTEFEELRTNTLKNLTAAAEVLRGLSEEELSTMTMSFEREGKQTDYSMYNAINGPIADALTHVGQIVSFRRTTGNPRKKGVNVFLGTAK